MAARSLLSDERREEIFQTYVLCGSKKLTAQRCAVSPYDVHRVLSEVPADVILKARQEAVAEIASRVNEKVLLALDSLGPDDFKRENGKGPSVMQKTTAAAILVDKRVLLEKYMLEYEAIQAAARASARPLPPDVPTLVAAIQNMLRTLGVADAPAPAPAILVPPDPSAPVRPEPRALTLEDLDLASKD